MAVDPQIIRQPTSEIDRAKALSADARAVAMCWALSRSKP
jgi:hypothetical protein